MNYVALSNCKDWGLGSKNKLKRFKENEDFKNVIQPTREELLEGYGVKGNWKSRFGNIHPIVLELGCGKGEYTIGLAKRYPQKNFIGVDIKGARFWKGAKTALEERLPNVLFVRTQIELIDLVLEKTKSLKFGLPSPIHRSNTSVPSIA